VISKVSGFADKKVSRLKIFNTSPNAWDFAS
jgi:hypothetical protein